MHQPTPGVSSLRQRAVVPARLLPTVIRRIRSRCAAALTSLLFLVVSALPAHAATATYEILLDLDRNGATGCIVSTPKGDVGGIEQLLLTTVATNAAGATVTGIARRACSGGVLGGPIPVDAGGWPVGFANGHGGMAVVETYVPKTALGASAGAFAAVVSSGGGGADAIVASAGGGPIAFAITGAASGNASAIPALSPLLLVVLGAFVLALAKRFGRGHRLSGLLLAAGLASAAAGLSWAASALLDGNAGDWTGIPPLATDAQGNAPPDADLVALFVQEDATRVHFRIDANVVVDAAANQPPLVNAGGDQAVTLPATASLSGTASDDGLPNPPAALTLAWTTFSGPGTVVFSAPNALSTTASFPQAGIYVLRLTANDGALAPFDDVQVTVSAAGNTAPTVYAGADQTIALPATASLSGTASDDGLPNPPASVTIAWTKHSGPGTVTFGNPAAVVTTGSFSQDGVYVLRLTVSDGSLSTTDDVQVTVNPEGSAPLFLPSAIDPTVATTLFESTKFLYAGSNPVQTRVAPGTIDGRRASVTRGRVIDGNGDPLEGVTVAVHRHSELGQTQTRADGRYDLVVNGGGPLTLSYAKAGLLPVQRTRVVAWREYANLPDVAMIAVDTAMTTIAANALAMQVHQSTPQSDASGTRRVTLLFPAGTTATMDLPGGATQPLSTLAVRATEYTVGPNGPAAMPGVLPPTSAYTYAVELSADEALAAGAKRVTFNQPVPVYVDNFLGFPAGTIVPAGFYDRDEARWMPAPNGRVVKIVSIDAGSADLDVTGDDVADDPATTLAALGITLAERQQLAALFSAGQSHWRTPTTHFSTPDYNWPFAPPGDAKGAGTEGATTDESVDQCLDEAAGSIIECQNQILGQSVGIVGTPFTLNYRSDRVPGREIARTIDVAASGASIPPSVKRIELKLSVAGQEYTQSLPALANQRPRLVWDGKDAYGRTVQGRQSFTGSIDYVYDAVYTQPGAALGAAFGQFGGVPISSDTTRMEFRFPQPLAGRVGVMDARGYGIGGWTLSAHHAYDPEGEILYLGNGKRLAAGPVPLILERVAGLGEEEDGENVPGTQVYLDEPTFVAVAPDGAVVFSEARKHRVRRVGPDGSITTIAGSPIGDDGFGGDGGPATLALLDSPAGVAFGPDGSLYIVDGDNLRVRRIDPAGTITTVAGSGVEGFSGDGGPALAAAFRLGSFPPGIAVGPDGAIYVFDTGNSRVRRIGTDGIVTTVAGGGRCCEVPDGIPATDGWLFGEPGGLAVDRDGALYVALFRHVVRIGPDGIATIIAGTDNTRVLGDGGPARNALLWYPKQIAVGPDGSLYVADEETSRIRRIGTGGIITTVVGGGSIGVYDPAYDGVAAKGAELSEVFGVAVAPDGSLFVTEGDLMFRARPPLPDFAASPINVASPDARQLFQFDLFGRHLRTRDALTGAVLVDFGYDASGRLVTVNEKTGDVDNVTTIQRDANGHPTAVVAPFGQVTRIVVDANGFVSEIENPASEVFAAAYTTAGLMESFTKPGNRTSEYQYEPDGRLKRADDAADGHQALVRGNLATGFQVARTTALGLVTVHGVETLADGTRRLTTVNPEGTQSVTQFGDGSENEALGVTENVTPDGTQSTTASGPDPRFGMQSPFTLTGSTGLPSGLTMKVKGTRAAVLSNPADILSVVSLTDTNAVNSRKTTSTYAAASRTRVLTTPAGRTFTTVIDALGRVASTQLGGLAAVLYGYDSRGRVESMTQGTGSDARTYAITYDAQGFPRTLTDPLGRTVDYTRDAAGRATVKTLPGGTTVGFGFNAAGDLASVTPPGRPAHVFVHNARGDVTSVTPPAVPGSGTTTLAYDPDRRITQIARAGGEVIDSTFDAAGRPSGQLLTNVGLPASTYGIGYDASGRVASLAGPGTQSMSFTYDGGLITGVGWIGPVAASYARTLDSSFRMATESVNGGSTIGFGYDNDNRITQAGDLAIGRVAQNGLIQTTTLGVVTDGRTRNAFGEVTGYSALASGSALFGATFARDALGRIAEKQETIAGVTDTYVYAYDPRGQLGTVTRNGVEIESYAYDANGNRTSATVNGASRTATFDAQDRIVSDGAATLAFTPAGRLASRTVAGQTTAYQYDALGNLLKVTLPSGTVVEYQVDGLNRRIGRSVGGVADKRFVHRGLHTVAELDGAGNLVSRFVYATGIAPDYMVKGGATYRILTDRNGSVRLVVDAATGAIAQRIDYDSFGSVVLDTQPGFQPFGFAGGLSDPDTGLVRFGARDYDPATGRWTSKDPIGFAAGDANLYRYVGNDPVMRIDPTGTNDWVPSDLARAEHLFDDITDVFETDVVDNTLTPRQAEALLNKTVAADYVDLARKGVEKAMARARTFAREAAKVIRLNAGGAASVCLSALGAIDVMSTIGDAYENGRSLLEQVEYEEQMSIEAGNTQALTCAGALCYVKDLTQY